MILVYDFVVVDCDDFWFWLVVLVFIDEFVVVSCYDFWLDDWLL